ncbi:amidase [Chelatococcus reniformis]|uniref:Amidase n=1 Tax=Chelatococcus reniformis TaxID=1494448 RepID=A0A916UR13_9HYPH|nr:amidase [Chelatococcus reniformis]GGC80923.1 amidase [Chelatococcus reniformis]
MDNPSTLAQLLTRGETTAEAVTAEALARIDAANPHLGAFVQIARERALIDAGRLDALTRAGSPRGPLFGVPVGVKDIIDVAGLVTGGGSLTRSDVAVAAASAVVVRRLEAAGAVVVGKTATVEYAFGGWGTNETLGTPVNPWDLGDRRVPGGSSNGSGVAVAAGLVPLALGTDTGGSVRLPAAFCGVVGLKTSIGLVDRAGVLPLSVVLDTVGPLTRTVADAALALTVMAETGHLRGAPLAELARGIVPPLTGVRIGVADLGAPLDPDVAAAFDRVLGLLANAGAEIVAVELEQPVAGYVGPCGLLIAAEGYRYYGHLAEAEPNRLGPPVRERLLSGKAISAPAYLAALDERQRGKAKLAAVFDRIDALVTPTAATPAPTVAAHDEDASPGVFTRFANFFDLAALSVPAGLSRQGLPIGFQINVPALHEPRALAIGATVEAAVGRFTCPPVGGG